MTRRHEGQSGTGGESGSSAVELVLMVPVMMTLVLSVVAGGRYVDSRGQVNDAAYAAARAASLETTLEAGQAAGRDAAAAALAERGKACVDLDVSFVGTNFQPGGHIETTVTCRADLRDVMGFGVPGTKSFTTHAVVPIEKYRNP